MKTSTILKSALLGATAAGFLAASPALAKDVSACLITKTDTNPFFVKMKEGASAKAKELGVTAEDLCRQGRRRQRKPGRRNREPASPTAPRAS